MIKVHVLGGGGGGEGGELNKQGGSGLLQVGG